MSNNKSTANWVNDKVPSLTLNDKLKELIRIGYKLVLVQLHELERIRLSKHKDRYSDYIEMLYNHYIVLGLPKMYIQS